MTQFSILLLGSFVLSAGGAPVASLKAIKAQALLAYLAVESGQLHRRDALAALLWPDQPDAAALHSLRQAIYQLRQVLSDSVQVERGAVRFDPAGSAWVDVDAFGEAVAAYEGHGHRGVALCASCAQRLEEAVDLYRGEFLSGLSAALRSAPFEEWLVVQRERYHRQTMEALGALAAHYERTESYEQAERSAHRQLEMEPWQEAAHRQLMRALALRGDRGAALAQYEACQRILEEELGIEPGFETTALYQRIREGAAGRELITVPAHNLPAALSPFMGREAELTQIDDWLADPARRLLTVVGPGGTGKTRLALEAARRQLGRFADGVFFVPLAGVSLVEGTAPAIAQSIGLAFAESGDPEGPLLRYLRSREVLLLLDNVEHLVNSAGLVTRLLQSAPAVKVFITSRIRLDIRGEQVLELEGLKVPKETDVPAEVDACDAVALFVQYARRVYPAFEPTRADLAHVGHICRLVGGMPLGILLAAAWVDALPPSEIAAEIEQGLGFLQADWHDAPERHRSMRAAFEPSWRLLTEDERRIFARLSVFRGGFAREAAREVAGADLSALRSLVRKSLLQRDGAGRYHVHELLRQYAQARLDEVLNETEEARNRHSEYYAAALEQWATELKSAQQQVTLAAMAIEIDNALAAWSWMAERKDVEQLGRALEGLSTFLEMRGRYREGERACQIAAAALPPLAQDGTVPVLALTSAWQGVFTRRLGRTEAARRLLQQSLDLLDSDVSASHDVCRERAFVSLELGQTVYMLGNRERARQLYAQSLELGRTICDRWGLARALERLGWTAMRSGQPVEAERRLEESLAIRRALGVPRATADALSALGFAAWHLRNSARAEALIQESISIYERVGDPVAAATARHYLAEIYHWPLGRFAEVCSLEEQALTTFEERGIQDLQPASLRVLGYARAHQGAYAQARIHAQRALEIAREAGFRHEIAAALNLLSFEALTRGALAEALRLSEESLDAHQEPMHRSGGAVALTVAGYVALGLRRLDRARQCLSQALALQGTWWGLATLALPGVALLLAAGGELERAVEVYALALSHSPALAASRLLEDVAGKQIAALTASLPPDIAAAAKERGQAQDLWVTVEELLAELGAT
jgi:predicted ATPase/DNA-binding SARP family transcriptional activator